MDKNIDCIDTDEEDEERLIETKITYNTNYKKKNFSYKWLEKEEFRHWLAPVKENKNLCKCICCNKTITCGKTELQKHEKSLFHQRNFKSTKSTKKLNVLFEKATKEKDEQMEKEKQIKNAEIIFSSYIADHNIAFCNIEHLVPMLRNALPDSQILKGVKLHRQKCTSIIKKCYSQSRN